MNKNSHRITGQLIAILIVSVLIMVVMGYIFFTYIDKFIDSMAEKRILNESRTAAEFYAEDLRTEMMTIEHIGALLENDKPYEQTENIQRAKYVIENVFVFLIWESISLVT